MKYFKGTSKSDRELSYLSLTRQEEAMVVKVITRLHRQLSDKTHTEQDSIIDLTSRFILKGNSLTLLQFEDLEQIAINYRIKLPLDPIDMELADKKDQYGETPSKRRVGVMEKEMTRKIYEGKLSLDTIIASLAAPTEEQKKELKATGYDSPESFLDNIERYVKTLASDCWVAVEVEVDKQLISMKNEIAKLKEEVVQLRVSQVDKSASAASRKEDKSFASLRNGPVSQRVSSEQPVTQREPEGRASATSEENAQVKPKAKPKASKQLTAMRERLKARQVAMQ